MHGDTLHKVQKRKYDRRIRTVCMLFVLHCFSDYENGNRTTGSHTNGSRDEWIPYYYQSYRKHYFDFQNRPLTSSSTFTRLIIALLMLHACKMTKDDVGIFRRLM